jgi:hypothetical protein
MRHCLPLFMELGKTHSYVEFKPSEHGSCLPSQQPSASTRAMPEVGCRPGEAIGANTGLQAAVLDDPG